jgi:hypothetical protein
MSDCGDCKKETVYLYLNLKAKTPLTQDLIQQYMDGLVRTLQLSEIQAEQILTIGMNKGSCYLFNGEKSHVKSVMDILVDEYEIPCRLESLNSK